MSERTVNMLVGIGLVAGMVLLTVCSLIVDGKITLW